MILQRIKAFGDVVMVEPILDHLLKKGKKVTFITSPDCFDIFDGKEDQNLKIDSKKPYIKQLFRKLFFKIHRLRYERYPQISCQEAYAKILGLDDFVPRRPKLHSQPTQVSKSLAKPYVVIHTETNSDLNYRNIYGVDWEKVAEFLVGQGLHYYQIEGNTLKDQKGEEIAPMSIKDLKAVMAESKLFVGNDSFPSHVAVAFEVPSIIFFGAVDPKLRHPDLSKVMVMQNDCEFSGCYHEPKYYANGKKTGNTVCQIVVDAGVPPCCEHSSEKVIAATKKLLEVN